MWSGWKGSYAATHIATAEAEAGAEEHVAATEPGTLTPNLGSPMQSHHSLCVNLHGCYVLSHVDCFRHVLVDEVAAETDRHGVSRFKLA